MILSEQIHIWINYSIYTQLTTYIHKDSSTYNHIMCDSLTIGFVTRTITDLLNMFYVDMFYIYKC